MAHDLYPMTIVATKAHDYAVITALIGENEYKVTPLEISNDGDRQVWSPGLSGHYNRDEICPVGFCENDYLPGFILATVAGYAHRYGNRINF